ncbi:MAG: alpha/beta fold hydrolase [Cryobacterium sp.]|nr:alpha/beta fold hydrolase [Cryobacterium sp.]MBX3104967.1 alpha/beta fold hydrolase [Cryobacterium sp.]
MAVKSRQLQDLKIDEHTLKVPLVWGDKSDSRTIEVFVAIVSRPGGENLPYLVYLQGGPGHEAPRPMHSPVSPSWLDAALAHYRVVMIDQRGTGRSTPVGDFDLAKGAGEVAEYLTHLRADAIVSDCEALRIELGAKTWSVLGQSFGGFTTLAYISTNASSLSEVYITGGLSAIGRHPDEIYSLTYEKMRAASERYYRRFPEHRNAVRSLVGLAEEGSIELPDGEIVSPSRLRSLGMLLGTNDGWQAVHNLLELSPKSNGFRYDLAGALPFSARNPLYYVIHESSFSDGFVTNWSAERTEPESFKQDATLLTGEHVRREWLDTVPGLKPWKQVAEIIAKHDWPVLYNRDKIQESKVVGAAAVYQNDVYVPLEFSMETGALMPGVIPWVTSEQEHSGLRQGVVLPRLIDLARGRVVR